MKAFLIYPVGTNTEYKTLLIRLFYSQESDPYSTFTKRVDLTWQANKGSSDFYGFTIDASIQDNETAKLVNQVCRLFAKNHLFYHGSNSPEKIVTCLLENNWKQVILETNSSKFIAVNGLDLPELSVFNVIDPKKPDSVFMSIVATNEIQAKKKAFDYLIQSYSDLANHFDINKSGKINYVGTILPVDSFLESVVP
ncbi:MAG: hypothetical protein ACW981_21730 [Candidatus Hodarchaeales archaeon]|jgi:hypothetical protein